MSAKTSKVKKYLYSIHARLGNWHSYYQNLAESDSMCSELPKCEHDRSAQHLY